MRPLETIERRLAGDRRAVGPARLQLARQYREHRIVAQGVVIDQILIAERQAENSLPHKRRDGMLDQFGIAPVDEAFRHPLDQPDRPVSASQKQRPSVGRHRPAVEVGDNFALFHGCEFK